MRTLASAVLLAAAVVLARSAAAQQPAPARDTVALAASCPARNPGTESVFQEVLATSPPDSAIVRVGAGVSGILSVCHDLRALGWLHEQIRREAPVNRPIAGRLLGLLQPFEEAGSVPQVHQDFLVELVRDGYTSGRDDSEPRPQRDLQSYILEAVKRSLPDEAVTKLYFELVGTDKLDPIFGEGRLIGHLTARRGDAFLGEFADLLAGRPDLVRDPDRWFYANQIVFGRPAPPGSGAERLAKTLRDLEPVARQVVR